MKKKISITGILMLTLHFVFAQSKTDDFSGSWKDDEGKVIVITNSPAGFIGHTEDGKKILLKEAHFTDGKWKAIIMKPDTDDPINCELLLAEGNLKIIARKGIFSKTILFTKVKR